MPDLSKLRILVLGYIVRRPIGGGNFSSLQYTLGLRRLGHDVWFLEDSEDWPCCYDPTRHVTDEDPTFGLQYAKSVFEQFGLGDRWAYHDAHRSQWHGPCAGRIDDICRDADLVLNVSAINPIRPWLADVPHRAYIDTDPAFEQVRQLTDEFRRERAGAHNVFFTFGENIPAGKAVLPEDGIAWQATRQPVVLDLWPVTPGPSDGKLTTVMLWNSYAARDHGCYHLGMKSESFEDYLDLPAAVEADLEIALGGPDAPRSMLREKGWNIVNPLEVTVDPAAYQRYIRTSRGEFAVAKHGYVVSECGWFSERSAHYLASGRPVVTQETGFSAFLPTGSGLLSFSDRDTAVESIKALDDGHDDHCAAARAIAEAHFDSDKVLTSLVERAMQPASQVTP